jgi:ribosomal protein S8
MSSKGSQLQLYNFLNLLLSCFTNFTKFCEIKAVSKQGLRSYLGLLQLQKKIAGVDLTVIRCPKNCRDRVMNI